MGYVCALQGYASEEKERQVSDNGSETVFFGLFGLIENEHGRSVDEQ